MELELSRIRVNTVLAGLPPRSFLFLAGGGDEGRLQATRKQNGPPPPKYNREELLSESGPEGSRKHQVQGTEWTEE